MELINVQLEKKELLEIIGAILKQQMSKGTEDKDLNNLLGKLSLLAIQEITTDDYDKLLSEEE